MTDSKYFTTNKKGKYENLIRELLSSSEFLQSCSVSSFHLECSWPLQMCILWTVSMEIYYLYRKGCLNKLLKDGFVKIGLWCTSFWVEGSVRVRGWNPTLIHWRLVDVRRAEEEEAHSFSFFLTWKYFITVLVK